MRWAPFLSTREPDTQGGSEKRIIALSNTTLTWAPIVIACISIASRLKPLPCDRNFRAHIDARIKVQHILVEHPNATFGHRFANGPRRICSMYAIRTGTQIKRTHT